LTRFADDADVDARGVEVPEMEVDSKPDALTVD
jgi:hypothetical protein